MISKNISKLEEPIDVDLSVLAAELDISPNQLRYVSKAMLSDAMILDGFDAMITEVKNSMELMSFDDNTVLYEFEGMPVILFEKLGEKILLFDESYKYKVEARLFSYK